MSWRTSYLIFQPHVASDQNSKTVILIGIRIVGISNQLGQCSPGIQNLDIFFLFRINLKSFSARLVFFLSKELR